MQSLHDAPPGIAAPPPSPTASDALLALVLKRLDDDQAEDVVTVDLHGKSSMCDHMVIASGRSQRQVAAMAEHLGEAIRVATRRKPAIEGLPHADWVLIDGGDVVVHLFRPEVRRFYNLEKMWGIDLPDSVAAVEPRPAVPLNGPDEA